MIEHSSTIVVGSMMQIALRPLFHHENTVPIFYCKNKIIIWPAPPHNEISGLSLESTTCISASLWMLKLYIGKFSAPNLWQCSMSEESKKGRLVVACSEYRDFFVSQLFNQISLPLACHTLPPPACMNYKTHAPCHTLPWHHLTTQKRSRSIDRSSREFCNFLIWSTI